MLVGVPAAAAAAALLSLRRVQISPLGVSRRARRKPPTFWRLSVLVLGVGLYVYGLSKTTHASIGAQAYPGLLLTMVGLVIAGPWLTSAASRLFGRLAPGSSALLATPARVGLLRADGHRPGRRLRRDRGDAAAAAPHDIPGQRPLRITPGASGSRPTRVPATVQVGDLVG